MNEDLDTMNADDFLEGWEAVQDMLAEDEQWVAEMVSTNRW